MDLFRKLIFGTADDQRPPTLQTLRNEINRNDSLMLWTYSPTQSTQQFNYAFLDFREAQALDGGTLAGAEIFLNNQYLETILFNNNEFWYYKQIPLGVSDFKARVFDNLNQYSPMSPVLSYFLTQDPNQYGIAQFYEDVYTGSSVDYTDYTGHILIERISEVNYLMNLGILNVFIDFELIPNVSPIPQGSTFTLTLIGNYRTPTMINFNSGNSWGGSSHKETINIGKNYPNEYGKWSKVGVLGFRIERKGLINYSDVSVKLTIRTVDSNNVTNTKSITI